MDSTTAFVHTARLALAKPFLFSAPQACTGRFTTVHRLIQGDSLCEDSVHFELLNDEQGGLDVSGSLRQTYADMQKYAEICRHAEQTSPNAEHSNPNDAQTTHEVQTILQRAEGSYRHLGNRHLGSGEEIHHIDVLDMFAILCHLTNTVSTHICYQCCLQPTSDGLQPTSDGLQPSSDGLQPKSDGLQSSNSVSCKIRL